MPYTLGIIIDGARVKDEDGRIIAFLFHGLSYLAIGNCMDYETTTVRNHIHKLYGDLGIESEVQALLRKCLLHGFDTEGNYKGKPVLTAADIKRMHRVAPQTAP